MYLFADSGNHSQGHWGMGSGAGGLGGIMRGVGLGGCGLGICPCGFGPRFWTFLTTIFGLRMALYCLIALNYGSMNDDLTFRTVNFIIYKLFYSRKNSITLLKCIDDNKQFHEFKQYN